MNHLNYYIFAHALHVVAVVIWIGGVAFVTTVLLPSLKKLADSTNKITLFEQLESRFSFQAKITTLLTGLSGFYMLDVTHAWDHYQQLQFWWIPLMTFIWFLFTLVLFVLEPLFLHRWFHQQAEKNCSKALALIYNFHKILLFLSLLAVMGAAAGAHGFNVTR